MAARPSSAVLTSALVAGTAASIVAALPAAATPAQPTPRPTAATRPVVGPVPTHIPVDDPPHPSALTARLARSVVALRAGAVVTGTITPRAAGRVLLLEERRGTQWRVWQARTATRANGTYSLRIVSHVPGRYEFRVVAVAEPHFPVAISPVLTVDFRTPLAPPLRAAYLQLLRVEAGRDVVVTKSAAEQAAANAAVTRAVAVLRTGKLGADVDAALKVLASATIEVTPGPARVSDAEVRAAMRVVSAAATGRI